mmetsp:Transcript_70683/g.218221  ORF Transcript_70683/g.218221 Transcript_70683/m.218221 type:complete len:213 (-) Transcript_70683:623-1261(-)
MTLPSRWQRHQSWRRTPTSAVLRPIRVQARGGRRRRGNQNRSLRPGRVLAMPLDPECPGRSPQGGGGPRVERRLLGCAASRAMRAKLRAGCPCRLHPTRMPRGRCRHHRGRTADLSLLRQQWPPRRHQSLVVAEAEPRRRGTLRSGRRPCGSAPSRRPPRRPAGSGAGSGAAAAAAGRRSRRAARSRRWRSGEQGLRKLPRCRAPWVVTASV